MKFFNILVLLQTFQLLKGQDDTVVNNWNVSKYISLRTEYQDGYIFATNEFIKGKNSSGEQIKNFQALSLKFAKQTIGNNLWEQIYNYPYLGLGLYIADFNNSKEIGLPYGIYGFFNGTFKKWGRLSLGYELGFGVICNWKSYNPITNQYNIAIGAGESFLIDGGLNLHYNLTEKIDLIAGVNLTHFSNGALKKPNYGINTVSPTIGLKYNFYEKPKYLKQQVPVFSRRNEWLYSVFGGIKNVIYDSVNINIKEKYEGVFFPTFGLTVAYNRQFSYLSKIGIGMTFSYDGSVDAQIAVDNNELDPINSSIRNKLQISIYPSYELIINKMSLILQPAFYLYHKKTLNQSPIFHQRIGIKYHFNNNIFIGVILRDYAFHVSDHIEWTLGYRILN